MDCIADPESPDAYFQDFERKLANSSHVKDVYLRTERVLRELDTPGWEHLKSEAVPRLTRRDKRGRGWQQLFETLNEARAYTYLKSIGCIGVRFIPRSSSQTPDLEGTLGSVRVLCEVKTINPSDEEIAARSGPPKVSSIPMSLTPEFLKKLRATLMVAKQQMLAYDPQDAAIHYVYLNVSFDDFFAVRKEAYFEQIDEYIADEPVTSIQLVVCNDYTAYYKPLQMRNAVVDNAG